MKKQKSKIKCCLRGGPQDGYIFDIPPHFKNEPGSDRAMLSMIIRGSHVNEEKCQYHLYLSSGPENFLKNDIFELHFIRSNIGYKDEPTGVSWTPQF